MTSPYPAQPTGLARQTYMEMDDLVPRGQIILAYQEPAELDKQLPRLLAKARLSGQHLLLLRLFCLNKNETHRKRQIANLEIELRSLNARLQNQQELISIMILPCATLEQLFTFAVHHQATQLLLTDDLMQAYA
ncbi:MAG: hypothetical protein KDE59_09870 [Anaerolineales bacterium]|nr:hypothetical protein [Anaerolineales bacterium]MCB0005976.1 hypothetical protein [Anaerolineales bacterium]